MIKLLRAEETWQKAGAYYVRIQAMAKKYNITLREEFDEKDSEGTRYIVLLDDEFPVATSRFYDLGDGKAMIGRVVVLPEYRGQNLGKRVVEEAEKWLKELGYQIAVVESRLEAIDFYKKHGYIEDKDNYIYGETFTCLHMEKHL